jgi:RNA polymerase sigma factor (sigma-70 family)
MAETAYEVIQQVGNGDGEPLEHARLARVSDVASLAVCSQHNGNGHMREVERSAPVEFVAPGPNMSDMGVVDYFVPQTGLDRIVKLLAINRETCRELQTPNKSCVEDNTARAVVFLLKARNTFDGHDELEQQTLHEINLTLNCFAEKTFQYVRYHVEPLMHPKSPNELHDLMGYGQVGLLEALHRFDLNVDYQPVLQYCTRRVIGSALDAQADAGSMIRYSRSDYDRAKLLEILEDSPVAFLSERDQEQIRLAKEADERLRSRTIVQNHILWLLLRVNRNISRDVVDPIDEIPDPQGDVESTVIEQLSANERSDTADFLMGKLPSERDRGVVAMQFGLPPYEREYSLKEIANECGISKSRAGQLSDRALRLFHSLLSKNDLVVSTGADAKENMLARQALSHNQLIELQQASLGLTAAETAKDRRGSIWTSRSYRAEIIAKLDAVNMQHAIRRGFELELKGFGLELLTMERGVDENSEHAIPTMIGLQILEYLSYGYDGAQMAQMLSMTEGSIKKHREALCRCIGATTRCHAVRLGFEKGHLESNRRLYT